MIVDLHTHTTASDGQYTPTGLVELAKGKGLDVLAVTDHDTMAGVDEAVAAGKRLGVHVLRGVEFSADEYLNLHILGYNVSESGSGEFLSKLQEGRDTRKYVIAEYLRGKGFDVDLSEVERLAGNKSIGRPHFAIAMLKAGFVKTRKEAFDLYLDTTEFHDIDTHKPSMKTCIEKIKADGGKVSLAHPYQIVLGNDSLEDLIKKLAELGLDAIECYYTKHTPEQIEEYLRLAKKYHLHVTGGSDFHGEKYKPDYPMAALKLDIDWLME